MSPSPQSLARSGTTAPDRLVPTPPVWRRRDATLERNAAVGPAGDDHRSPYARTQSYRRHCGDASGVSREEDRKKFGQGRFSGADTASLAPESGNQLQRDLRAVTIIARVVASRVALARAGGRVAAASFKRSAVP